MNANRMYLCTKGSMKKAATKQYIKSASGMRSEIGSGQGAFCEGEVCILRYANETKQSSDEVMSRFNEQNGQVNKSIRWMPWH